MPGGRVGSWRTPPRGRRPPEGSQVGGLAGPVGADQSQPAAGRDVQIQVLDNGPAVVGDSNLVELDRAHSWRSLVERITKRKNGAPTIAVTTPIGISAGAVRVLAAVSPSTRNDAPRNTNMGSTVRELVRKS